MDSGCGNAEWAERARKFAVAQGRLTVCRRWYARYARVDMDDLDRATSQLTHGLPAPLRAFLLEAGELSFEYFLHVPRGALGPLLARDEYIVGGADISLATITESQRTFDSLVDDSAAHHDALGLYLLRHGCPFIAWDDGDRLALDTSQAELPVCYWSHDWHSYVVSSSFTSFLRSWETINYLKPCCWGAFFVQSEGSMLGSNDESAALRAAWDKLT